MNEEYLKGLHEHLGIKEDYDTWISKTQDNDEYLQGLHGHLGIKDDYGTWKTKTWGEKKNSNDITSTQEPSSETATTTAEESVSEAPSTSTEEVTQPVVQETAVQETEPTQPTKPLDPYYQEKGQEAVESFTPQYGLDQTKQEIPNNETVQADSEQAVEEFQETGKVDVGYKFDTSDTPQTSETTTTQGSQQGDPNAPDILQKKELKTEQDFYKSPFADTRKPLYARTSRDGSDMFFDENVLDEKEKKIKEVKSDIEYRRQRNLKTENQEAELDRAYEGVFELREKKREIEDQYNKDLIEFSNAEMEKTSTAISEFEPVFTEKAEALKETSRNLLASGALEVENGFYKFKNQEDLDAYKAQSNDLQKEAVILDMLYKDQQIVSGISSTADYNKIREETVGEWDGFINSIKRGWNQGGSTAALMEQDVWGKDISEVAKDIALRNAENQGLLTSEGYQKFTEAEDLDEALAALGQNPFEVTSQLFVESMSMLLSSGRYIIPTTVATGVATGAAVGSVVPGVGTLAGGITGLSYGLNVGMSTAGFGMEYYGMILEEMSKAGLDIANPEDVEKGLMDEELMSKAKKVGLSRGVPILLVDLLSGGIAGRVTNVGKIGLSTTQRAGRIGAELAIQSGAEGFGEYGAQVSAGIFSGEGIHIEGKEILAEIAGGWGSSVPQGMVNIAADKANKVADVSEIVYGDANKRYSTLEGNGFDANILYDKIDKAVVKNEITEKAAEEAKSKIVQDVEVLNSIPETVSTPKNKKKAFELLSERAELSKQNKTLTGDAISKIDEKLQKIAEDEAKPKEAPQPTISKNSTPTDEDYGTVNLHDGTGIKKVTKEEYEAYEKKLQGDQESTDAPTTEETTKREEGEPTTTTEPTTGVEPSVEHTEIGDYVAEEGTKTTIETGKSAQVSERMNNKELINEAEMTEASDELYTMLDDVDKRTDISEESKERIKSKIESEIDKIEGYEFETETKTSTTTQEGAIKGSRIIGKEKRKGGSKSQVTADRFDGAVVDVIDPETGETSTTIASVNDSGGIDVTNDKGEIIPMDTGTLQYSESKIDADGNLSVVLEDVRDGKKYEIKDNELALDISIQEKEKSLGPIEDSILEEVLEDVTTTTSEEVLKEKAPRPVKEEAKPVAEKKEPTQITDDNVKDSTPDAIQSSSGFVYVRNPDGSYTDGDVTYNSLEEALKAERESTGDTNPIVEYSGDRIAEIRENLEDVQETEPVSEEKKIEVTPEPTQTREEAEISSLEEDIIHEKNNENEKWWIKALEKKIKLLKRDPIKYWENEIKEAKEEIAQKERDRDELDEEFGEGYTDMLNEEYTDKIKEAQENIDRLDGKETVPTQKWKSADKTSITKDNLADIEAVENRTKDPVKKKAIGAIKNVIKALLGVDPNVVVNTYESQQAYNLAIAKAGGSSKEAQSSGFFEDETGEIHLNVPMLEDNTLFHEATHKVIESYLRRSPKAVEVFEKQLRKSIPKSLTEDLDDFTSYYSKDQRAEEFVTEFVARVASGEIVLDNMPKSTLQKIIDAFKSLARKAGLPLTSIRLNNKEDVREFANKLDQAFNEGREIDIINNSQDVLFDSDPYSDGEQGFIKPDATLKPIKTQLGVYPKVDFAKKLPTKTLKEVVDKYGDRIYFITSDATGLGYDSNGDPIYGGLGYLGIRENVDNGIGFASLGDKEGKGTLTKMYNRIGGGKPIAVMVMVQAPSATVGNYYGGKFFGRGLKQIKESGVDNYSKAVESIKEFIEANKAVKNALKKNKTTGQFFDLLDNIDNYSEVEFAKEFIKDTSFDVRRELLASLLIDNANIATDKSTPAVKTALKDLGFNKESFLEEYGDSDLKDLYADDLAGYLVGGFELTLPENSKDIASFYKSSTKGGVNHPQFNGKVPKTGDSFYLDGLYNVADNFKGFIKPQTKITTDKELRQKTDSIVRKRYKNEVDYALEYRKGGDKYVPKSKRGYTHLEATRKSKFKEFLAEKHPEMVSEKETPIIAEVARSMGVGFKKGVSEEMKSSEFKKRKPKKEKRKIAAQKYRDRLDASRGSKGIPTRVQRNQELAKNKADYIKSKVDPLMSKFTDLDRATLEREFGKEFDKKGSKDVSKKNRIKFQIIGKNAQLKQNVRDNLQVARDMENASEGEKSIRRATGWEKGADGKWRYEIDDIDITGDITPWTDEWKGPQGYVTKLTDLVSGKLIKAYPQLKKSYVGRGVTSDSSFGTMAQMFKRRTGWDIYMSDGIFNGDVEFGKSVLIHEIQHIIQDIEGFDKGDSPSRISYDKYKKRGGEVEARNVQKRMGMTQKERQETLLKETEDVAREDQILLEGTQSKIKLQKAQKKPKLQKASTQKVKKAEAEKSLKETIEGFKEEIVNGDIKPYYFLDEAIDLGLSADQLQTIFDKVAKETTKAQPISKKSQEVKKTEYDVLLDKYKAIKQGIRKGKFKGERELQSLKEDVRNYIKKALPNLDYTRGDIRFLMSEITRAKKAEQIDGILDEINDFINTKTAKEAQSKISEKLKAKTYKSVGSKRVADKLSIRVAKVVDLIKSKTGFESDQLKSEKREESISEISGEIKEKASTKNRYIEENKDLRKENKEISDSAKDDSRDISKSEASTIEKNKLKIIKNKDQISNIDNDLKALRDEKSLLKTTGKDLDGVNQSIKEIFSEIDKIEDKISSEQRVATESELDNLMALHIAKDYLEAQKFDNTDLFKTISLERSLQNLKDFEAEGRSELRDQKLKESERYAKELEDFLEDVGGVSLKGLTKEEAVLITSKQAGEEANKKKNKSILARIRESIANYYLRHEDSSYLIDRISKGVGESMGGVSQELITDKILKADEVFTKRVLKIKELIEDKHKEIWGKNWQKKMSSFQKPIKESGVFLLDGTELSLSQDQAYYLYNQYKNKANHSSFESAGLTNQSMQQLEAFLTPETKAFADWLVDDFYPSRQKIYNDAYLDIYRTDMPFIENYGGRIFYNSDYIKPTEHDLLSGSGNFNTTVSAQSTKERTINSLPISLTTGGNTSLLGYINDMEHFAAFARPIKDVNKLLSNPNSKSAIKRNNLGDVNKYLNHFLELTSKRGISGVSGAEIINSINSVFTTTALGMNPTLLPKQASSALAWTVEIRPDLYAKQSAKAMANLIPLWKEISTNSGFIDDRYAKRIADVLENYVEKSQSKIVPTNRHYSSLIDLSMQLVKQGDKMGIMGGMPVYLHYKEQYKKQNPGSTEQQAIDYAIFRFNKIARKTQQSSSYLDKDYSQTVNPALNIFNMFKTAQRQQDRRARMALRHIARSLRGAIKGDKLSPKDGVAKKGYTGENTLKFFMYHSVLPIMYQYISMGFPPIGDMDDEDWLDIGRAGLLGNINSYFMLGDMVIESIADTITEKPWAGKGSDTAPLQTIMTAFNKAYKEVKKAKTEEDKQTAWQNFGMLVFDSLSALPVKKTTGWAKNIGIVASGDAKSFQEGVLRMLNFSDYVIDKRTGKKKKSGSQKIGRTKTAKKSKK